MSPNTTQSTAGNPGIDFVSQMVQEWAHGQECGVCGQTLDGCHIRVDRVEAGRITLARFRDLLGVGRKAAQMLLERFDADGLTRRIGDERVLRRRGTIAP